MVWSVERRWFLKAFAVAWLIQPKESQAESPPEPLRRWTCTNQDCDPYVYDPRLGHENPDFPELSIPPGVAFHDLPGDWLCPVCGDPKSHFLPLSR